MRFLTRLITPIVHRYCENDLAKVGKLVQRLETELMDLQTEHASLRDSHMKLLKRTTGGGRPPGSVSRSETPSLDDIPKGDKVQLRRALAGMKHQ